MDTLSIYIPTDRRQAIAQGRTLSDRTWGAALFADVSGFTPLTEALVQELGPRRGADQLSRHLNTIYTALITEVDRYRGSVIAFSGDAITCWLDGDDGRRAVTCALAMQAAMKPCSQVTTPSGTIISLAIKVAVASGPARRFLVGDPQIQYIDALAGATLDRLATTEHHAQKGEVLVSVEVAEQLGDDLIIQEWRAADNGEERCAVVTGIKLPAGETPWPDLPADALTDDQIQAWLLPVVYKRLKGGQGQFLAELRPAVVLFARFQGIDYDHDETAYAQLDTLIRWAQNIIQRYEGALLQLTIGDKGSYLYAAFGAPIAHDDDANRAVAAALALRTKPAELARLSDIQIGVSWGRVWAGPYGGSTRRTYGVLGDEVNLAARLMSKAEPGQIWINQNVAEAVGRHFALRSLGPVKVKGKQAPVEASLVLARQASRPLTLFTSPLIGRKAELERMTHLLDQTLTAHGQILRLIGEPGMGKSRLSAALIEVALQRGARVAVGMSTAERTAYIPWRQIFQTLLDLSNPSADEDQASLQKQHIAAVENYLAATNPDWLVRLPLLGDLLGLPIPDNATTAAFEPKLRQSALFDLAVDIMQSQARTRPLLLQMDDAYFMDEASQGLSVALGRAMGQSAIFLLIVHRPMDTNIVPELRALPFHHELALEAISGQDLGDLITQRLGGPPGALLLSLIQAETHGNPFFAEEVVDALRETGSLALRADGQWVLAEHVFTRLQPANVIEPTESGRHWRLKPGASFSAADIGLPDTIQGVVLSRIDRLPETPQLTLKVASVIGSSFPFMLLNRAHPLQLPAPTLEEHVDLLENRDFTRLEIPPRQSYVFKHVITRDVAYSTFEEEQRRLLHQVVSRALEDLSPEAVTQLAHHTFAGEDWERALGYQIAAGQQARKLFANYEGIEYFRKALQCAGQLSPENTSAQLQLAHVSLGELLAATGQYDPAIEHLQQALDLAIALHDHDAQAHACRWIAYVYEFRSEYAVAVEWIQKGLQSLEDRETSFTAELLTLAAFIHSRQGNYDQALEYCQRSILIAERLAATVSLAFAYNGRAAVAYARGSSHEAIDDFKKALELYQQTDNIHGQALSYNGIGNAYFNLGQWPEADIYYRRARDIFIQAGDVRHQIFTNNNLGGIAKDQGRLDDARAFYQEALKALERVGSSVYVIGVLHMNLGSTFVRRREVEAARQHLATSQECFARVQARDFLPELFRYMAEAELVAGQLSEAQTRCQQALNLARELTMRAEEGSGLRVLGEIARYEGDFAQAERYFLESISILEEVGQEYELARTQLALAKNYLSQNHPKQSLLTLESCLTIFHRLDAHLDLAEADNLQKRLANLV